MNTSEILAKFEGQNEINVVFLGGSITQGCGASEQSKCFANMTGEWLKAVFGADRLNYYNMGVGGTPSKYGLIRFKRDVASYNPHLVFIEFAVNDGDRDTRQYVEGLVRGLSSLSTKPYVVFLYTTDEEYTTETKYFNEVAKYYCIPEISLKDALKKHLNGANAREAGCLMDSVHPTDKGYAVYFEEMKRCLSLPEYYKRPQDKEKLIPETVSLSVDFTPAATLEKSDGWCEFYIEANDRKWMLGFPDDWFEFEFDGDVLAVEGGLHGNTCAFDVYVDGELIGYGEPWFNDEFITNQLALSFLTTDLANSHHKVRVVVRKSDKPERKSKHLCIYNVIAGKKFDI